MESVDCVPDLIGMFSIREQYFALDDNNKELFQNLGKAMKETFMGEKNKRFSNVISELKTSDLSKYCNLDALAMSIKLMASQCK